MHNPAIDIKNLTKIYRSNGKVPEKKALDDVSITIPKGSIFGLLGPNGAGKSTMINVMAGLVLKTSGHVKIWDYDIDDNMRAAKSSIGIVPQEINYDAFFSPLALLDLMGGLYGVPKAERQSMALLDLVGLKDKAHAYTRTLSGGMKRRLMMAKAMVHSPPILVLDEPTAGVDVELRKQLWENVRTLNQNGTTILLTTHYLEEAEELCDEIAIINKGRIIANESKDALVARIDRKEIIFYLDRDMTDVPGRLSEFCITHDEPRVLRVRYTPEQISTGELISIVQSTGYGIADISTQESDLEDVFVQLTGE